MAATVQQATTTGTNNSTPGGNTAPNLTQNPRLKRIVYSKYRELLGSYNDKANAIIETLPAYMVHEDRGFNFEPCLLAQQQLDNGMIYGAPPAPSMSGGIPSQRLPTQPQTYEAPACVQNAMMTKDKKPFTYTPGGIDLSQIKSERMAKRLARNAQAEGATGASQMNRPTQPASPAGSSPAAASMGAAAMGMPFQVFPTGPPAAPPPPTTGKQHQNFNGSAGAPPPPPPPTSNNSTLAPPTNNKNCSTLTAPSSPNAARKSPTPQRFEPPPMGFRPEIKIPANPMASLKKVAPPVEKNNFWVEEYRKERSKSPMVGDNDSNVQSNSNGSYENSNNNDDYKKSYTPTMTTPQQPATNIHNNNNNNNHNINNNNYQQYSPQAQQSYSPPTPQQHSPRPEFRSVAAPQSPSVNVYTQHSTDSSPVQQQQRATESPFKFAQQQSRPMQPISPLAQQHPQQQQQQQQSPSSAHAAQQQTAQSSAVPWRTQRSPQPPQTHQQQQPQQYPTQQQQQHAQQQHPQPIYNNVRSRDVFSPVPETTAPYQGPKPTNIGSLYIAPLAPSVEPQAQNIVRQQMQQQQAAAAQRDSPMRQMPQHQQQQRQPPTARWMSSQPAPKEQPAWARPEENGNVIPSSLQRMKSPEPMQQQQQQQQRYQPPQGNGYATAPTTGQSLGAAPTGLRLQINVGSSNPNGPKERIIPIQLEQTPTPTHTPTQPSFGALGGNAAPSSYVMRSPNQFVDQGYNNYPAASQQQQQMNAPRVSQQQQQQQANNNNTNNVGSVKTRIIPIALEGDGTRGPISQSPIVIQNDQRTTPVQSKSFRILQKITDTIDGDDNKVASAEAKSAPIESFTNAEPQLERPQFARQMSAQQARNSPTIEKMRRLQIAQEQLPALSQGNAMKQTQPNQYVQQPIYNNEDKPQQYVHPSEQHVPEPKKYTGSAIPSRSFKILQAMTTPENAAEMEDSDSIVVELNDKHSPRDNNSNQNQTTTSNKNSNCKNCSSNTSTPNPTPPPTCSSTSSLNSEHSSSAHSSHSSHPYHPYPPPYAYPWCPPMPPPGHMSNGVEQLPPNWNYPFPIPPPPPQTNGETTPNWHYPYPLPHPMPPKHPGDNSAHPHYPPYPYYYHPYYPPPPPPPHMTHLPPKHTTSSASSIEGDSQNAFDPRTYAYHPSYPYPPYPYPIITTDSQSSNPSSSASSALPDIIVTPSSDDGPSELMNQHKIKVEKPKRTDSVEIAEVSTEQSNCSEPMRREQREGSVIDMLTRRLSEIKYPNEPASTVETECREKTVAELRQAFDKKCAPSEISKPKAAPDTCEDDDETSSSDASEESSESAESPVEDDEETTKDDSRKRSGLKAIKSVTNVQVYKNKEREQELQESEDDEDDVTSADGESDIFDEEDEECEVSSMGAELELDECIEEDDDDVDDDDLLEQDYLSVIYEEESEMEKSGDTRTAFRNDNSSNSSEATTIDNKNLEREIEENDDDDDIDEDEGEDNNADEEQAEDSNSVTVRLPLKFSFSRSSNDENIATVEVGNSQIEERRNSLSLEEKRSTFSVAKLNLEDEEVEDEYEDDCDVSVTISLTPSSRSASFDKNSEPRFINNMEPTLKDENKKSTKAVDKSSSEDVSVSFSLSMRNKFLDQTINGGMTNNISADTKKKVDTTTKGVPMVKAEPAEDLDFFAMLRATKMQAQQMQEHSASYWGKSIEKATDLETEKLSETITEETATDTTEIADKADEEEEDEIEDIWASRDEDDLPRSKATKTVHTLETARNSFWSTVEEAAKEQCEVEHDEQVEPLEVDFWADIEKSKAEEQTQYVKENMQVVQHWVTNLKSREETMPRPQTAEIIMQATEEEEKVAATVEKKLKSSKKKTDKEKKTTTRKKKKVDQIESVENATKTDEKIQAEEVKETTVTQEPNKMEDLKVAEIRKTSVIEEQTCSIVKGKIEKRKLKVQKVRENTAEKEDFRTALNTNEEAQKIQLKEEHETAEVQENVWSSFKQTTKDIQTICPKLSQKENIESEIWVETTKTTEAIETEEAELDFWAEIEESKSSAKVCESLYDADKYPEEPREVDTDEEIDFWAEIEAKNNQSNDDITFHKAANFWASRDRQNSVEETPYKPLTKTAFHARLPDEPSVDMQAWAAALEAAKGEEPEIIDPAVEEESMLVAEFNNMPENIQEVAEQMATNTPNHDFETAELVADVYEVQSEVAAKAEEPDFWARIENENQKEVAITEEKTDERDELEMKRNNYRKAMAFFTTSVDEQKEGKVTRGVGERKSSINRNKSIDAETASWDWQAVEASTQLCTQINLPEANTNALLTRNDVHVVQEYVEEITSDRNTTPTNFETMLNTKQEAPMEVYQEALTESMPPTNGLPPTDLGLNTEEQKPSVRDRIHAFETGTVDSLESKKADIKMQSLSVESYSPKNSVSRNSGSQRSESEQEEEDSGVTDMNKQLSETDTESESFPELRKMTSYQRAATHSRLFKLLQDDNDDEAEKHSPNLEEQLLADEFQLKPSRRKIVHNVSITRRQNPKALQNAESMSERRERLSLPLRQKNSIDADNPSTPNSPASPILGQPNNRVVSDKLVNELVQSLLLKRDSSHLRTLPMEKLQAAAKRVLEEEMDSLENTSVETTPAPTPNSAKADRSYADYYDSWSDATGNADIVPSRAFRALQDRPKRSPWSVKCPRVLSSKTINRDLTRVTESPEIVSRSSKSPERLVRESPVSKWKKV